VTSPGQLEALLEVQQHDTNVDRLRRRQATLPERADLVAAEQRRAAVSGTLAEASSRLSAVADAQARLENDLAATEARIAEVEARMYSGSVSAARDLQAMAAEVESLRRRRSSLEDRILETMEEREPIDAQVAALEAEQAALGAEAARLGTVIGEVESATEIELAAELEQRAQSAAALPEPLLARYEQLRARLGGVGAARLKAGSCSGCHLALPATELDRLRREPEDALLFCDQCGRILVR
jgi:predicted  nucleic acid-binding Zn-ribbon protein